MNAEEDDDDMVIVLEDGELQLKHKENSELQSPMRSVNSVLREAENIMSDGPLQASKNKDNQQVLVDEVDFEYSPRKSFQPIEIVVRHNKVVEQSASDSDEDDGVNGKASQSKRLSTVHEGKEVEDEPCSSTSKAVAPNHMKRGHRRAWSMPNAKGEKMTVAVIHDKETMADGNTHRRRIVRYRLHPAKRNRMPGGTDAIEQKNGFGPAPGLRFDLSGMPHLDDDDNELEVEINEEEVVVPGESGKGARTIIKRFWEARWKATNFEYLPEWLQDNEYLRTGCVAFIGVALWFLTRSKTQVHFMEKVIFSNYFLGAILCLGMSFIFHTVACHSDSVGKFFNKLDYAGITLLIVGSFIPWLYYGFYCRPQPMIIYITMISVLGLLAMVVSLWDKFAQPKYRAFRAGVFVAMGLSAIFPAAHMLIVDGLEFMYKKASLVWMLSMGAMYIGGAAIYATRIPERWFPGKCDLWFQSHQLFHTFVVIAAFIHFHAITEMTQRKLMEGSCAEQLLERYGAESFPSLLGGLLGLDEDPNTKSWNSDMRPP
ncbi:hypothetical protein ANCCAN_06359 [Ancylostoma caninum]|uniref:Channel protein, hemolysin III family n=1 Tax=Ancylostoma caninum TaxID=29170 RepID=A0A368GX28_ANCCA|nr:hypothetical protein ANCCAN_06359 [Ancylostoma caninum]